MFKEKRYPVAMSALVLVNMLLFVGPDLLGIPCSIDDLIYAGAVYGLVFEDGEYYRLFTAAFLHFSFQHVLSNMFTGYILGQRLEPVIGSVRFLILYIVSAVGANVVSVFYYGYFSPMSLSAGASGAVFGIMGGLLAVALLSRNKSRVIDITPRQILIYAVLSVYAGFSASGVNNVAHISGLVFGFLMGIVLYMY